MIRAIIFDFDGLLVDTEPLWNQAEVRVYRSLGVPLTPQLCQETLGLGMRETVEHWYARFPWESVSQAAVAEWVTEAVIALTGVAGVTMMPGAANLLALAAQLGCPMGLASSSGPQVIEAVIRRLGLQHHFAAICSGVDEAYGKPHPAVYLTAATRLHVPPETCLVFEDSINGVLAAKAARMRCVAVPSPAMRTRKEYGIADLVLESLEQVTPELLERLIRS